MYVAIARSTQLLSSDVEVWPYPMCVSSTALGSRRETKRAFANGVEGSNVVQLQGLGVPGMGIS